MKKLQIPVEKILAYLSLLLTALILLSIVFNLLYYQQYNIEITNYMDISESLSLFIPYFVNILLNAFPKVIGLYLGLQVLPGYLRRKAFKEDAVAKIEDHKKPEAWDSILVATTISFVVSATGNYLLSPHGSFWTFEAALVSICILLIYIYQKYKNKLPVQVSFPVITIVFMVYLTYYFFQNMSGTSIAEKNNLYKQTITFKDSNQTIQTDSVVNIIGKTKDYLFLFNRKTCITTVISKDEIKQVEIGKIKK